MRPQQDNRGRAFFTIDREVQYRLGPNGVGEARE
jgi:hypothetical protein